MIKFRIDDDTKSFSMNAEGLKGIARILLEMRDFLHTGLLLKHFPRIQQRIEESLAPYMKNPWLEQSLAYRRLMKLLAANPSTRKRKLMEACMAIWGRVPEPHLIDHERIALSLRADARLTDTALMFLNELERIGVRPVLTALLQVMVTGDLERSLQEDRILEYLIRARVLPGPKIISQADEMSRWGGRLLMWLIEREEKVGTDIADLLDELTAGHDQETERVQLKVLWEIGKRHGHDKLTSDTFRRVKATLSSEHVRQNEEQVLPAALFAASPRSWDHLIPYFQGVETGIPDEVVRSLLQAALQQAEAKRVYGVPEVVFWVSPLDPFLSKGGFERITYSQDRQGNITARTAPVEVSFPVASPPPQIRGATLFLIAIACITYALLVTRQDRFSSQQQGDHTALIWQPIPRSAPTKHPVRVPRTRHVGPREGTSRSRGGERSPSYVIPHLRHLTHGRASSEAVATAAEHGIELPDAFTFVRGHVRGGGELEGEIAYTLGDIAAETFARFRQSRQQ